MLAFDHCNTMRFRLTGNKILKKIPSSKSDTKPGHKRKPHKNDELRGNSVKMFRKAQKRIFYDCLNLKLSMQVQQASALDEFKKKCENFKRSVQLARVIARCVTGLLYGRVCRQVWLPRARDAMMTQQHVIVHRIPRVRRPLLRRSPQMLISHGHRVDGTVCRRCSRVRTLVQ